MEQTMNANRVCMVGIILVGLAAVLAGLWGIAAYAVESRYGVQEISGADQYGKASGIQLIARSKKRQAQPEGVSAETGSASVSAENKSKMVRQQTPYGQCYSVCMARCQVTPVPVPTTNCASKCSQTCRPQAR
jgi:hypothetical protein